MHTEGPITRALSAYPHPAGLSFLDIFPKTTKYAIINDIHGCCILVAVVMARALLVLEHRGARYLSV